MNRQINKGWATPRRATISELEAAYIRLFRREAERLLRPHYPALERDEFDRIVGERATQGWARFESEALPGIIEDLRRG